jgi:hypothetical protein
VSPARTLQAAPARTRVAEQALRNSLLQIKRVGAEPILRANGYAADHISPLVKSPADMDEDLSAWLQSRLPDDALDARQEHEAERAADRVAGSDPDGENRTAPGRRISPAHNAGHRRPTSVGGMPSKVKAALGPGQPLDAVTREFFEARFGHDFSSVRIHSGTMAERSARDIDADAYTIGQHIVFAEGRYSPRSREGRRLIAHELAHVTQSSGESRVRRKKRAEADTPDITGLTEAGKAKLRDSIKRMTDAEKAELRDAISRMSDDYADGILKKLETRTISAAERQTIAGWRNRITQALKSAKTRPQGEQRDVPQQSLEALLASLSDDLTVKYWLDGYGAINWDNVAVAADPKKIANREQLDTWRAEAQRFRRGARGILTSQILGIIYQRLKVKPEDLRTEELTEAEAKADVGGAATGSPGQTQDPTASPRTVEDRLLLEDLYKSLPDAPDAPVGEEGKLFEAYKKLKPEERDQFKRYLQTTYRLGADPKPLSDAIADFKSLSAVDKEVMEVNKRMGEEEPTGDQKRLEGPVLLGLKKDAEQFQAAKQNFKKLRANLARLKGSLRDPSQAPNVPDLGIDIFVNEMAMAQGLMAGAKEKSPLIGSVVDTLMSELAGISQAIFEELAKDLAQSLLLAMLPVVDVVELAKIAEMIHKYYKKFEELAKIYETAKKVESVIDLISNLGNTYDQFREVYYKTIKAYETAQALLSDLNSLEDLEERIEAKEQELMDQFEVLLEGKFGDLLEMMYIPNDTSPEDLVKFIFEIPLGLEALKRMWDYYSSDASKSPDAEEILMIRGFEAGKLLYPFVGLLVAEFAKLLASVKNRLTAKNLTDRLMPSSQRTGGKERGRAIFRRRNRKRVKISEAALQKPLKAGAERLQQFMNDDEQSRHWAPAWFRFALRQELKRLNAEFAKSNQTVEAEVDQTVGKGRAKTKTTTKEQVPLPPFRLHFERVGRSAKEIHAKLELNPKADVKADLLTNTDFDKGVKYTGKPERLTAIRDWLGEAGYQLTHDNNRRLHIRLPKGQYETKERSYLRFQSDSIVRWKAKDAKDDYKNFLGRNVATSTDLPEGYLLIGESHKEDKPEAKDKDLVVQRKHRLGDDLVRLGLDKNQHLVEGAGEKQPEKLWPAKLDKVKTESYDPAASIRTMFGAERRTYNLQDKKDQGKWSDLVGREDGLKRRPMRLSGSLGYTVRARMGSDRLGSRYLPELKNSDDKGHLVARRFQGEDEYDNLVPMKRSLNQAPGKWYDLEQNLAQSYTGKGRGSEYITFTLLLEYPKSESRPTTSETRRPSKFMMNWTRKLAAKPPNPASSDKSLESHSDVFNND